VFFLLYKFRQPIVFVVGLIGGSLLAFQGAGAFSRLSSQVEAQIVMNSLQPLTGIPAIASTTALYVVAPSHDMEIAVQYVFAPRHILPLKEELHQQSLFEPCLSLVHKDMERAFRLSWISTFFSVDSAPFEAADFKLFPRSSTYFHPLRCL
jgi:hypothetical protein